MSTGLSQIPVLQGSLLLASLALLVLTVGLSAWCQPDATKRTPRWTLLYIAGISMGLWLALALSTIGFSPPIFWRVAGAWVCLSLLATTFAAIRLCPVTNPSDSQSSIILLRNAVLLGITLVACHWLSITALLNTTPHMFKSLGLWLGPLLAILGAAGWLAVIEIRKRGPKSVVAFGATVFAAVFALALIPLTTLVEFTSHGTKLSEYLHYVAPIAFITVMIVNLPLIITRKIPLPLATQEAGLLKTLLEHTREGIVICDKDVKIVMINQRLEAIIRSTRLTGPLSDSKFDQTKTTSHVLQTLLARVIKGEPLKHYELEMTDQKTEKHLFFSINSSIIENLQHEVTGAILLLNETTGLHEKQKYQKTSAYLTTQLPSEDDLAIYLEKILREADNLGGLSLIYLNLDDFKAVVYNYGFSVANQLLNAVAERLSQFLKSKQQSMIIGEKSFLAHVDGDQFAIILSGSNDKTKIAGWSQDILQLFNSPFRVGERNYYLRTSMGIANYPESGSDRESLLANAQVALYRAKQLGKNNFQFFSPEIRKLYHRQLQLKNDLGVALQENQFTLVYQPQQKLDTHALRGFEVLMRWHHPILGDISPDEFIPLAERNNLIAKLDEWVLTHALSQLNQWQKEGALTDDIKLAVNISASQLANKNFVDMLNDLLVKHHTPCHSLELEITETGLLGTSEQIPKTVKWLQKQGISLSLDDFGTGYSSLSRIRDFPINILKIDKSFIRPIINDVLDQEITKTILALSKSLYLQVVAEGVETVEQVIFLAELGCDYGQGYYFAKALDAASVPAFVKSLYNNNA